MYPTRWRSLLIVLVIFLSTTSVFAQKNTQLTEDQINQKVDSVMQKMNLTDKVGEMTQLTINTITDESEDHYKLDKEKLKKILLDYRVGSILNSPGVPYTVDQWHEIIRQIQEIAVNEKSTKIPVLYGIDSIHGAGYVIGSTLFPQQIGQAATWNTDLVREVASITAYETRAAWIPWTFSPVLGIGRDPRWSRFWETFGEDVYLTSEMGKATVNGYQDDDVRNPYNVTATAKHYLGYSLPNSGHDRTQAWIPERQLKEYVVPSFREAIAAGAHTVMVNSGEINGIPTHASKAILTDLLRDDLGFKGLAVTDWRDIINLYTRHHITKDYKESIKVAINAGIDMSMVPSDTTFPELLKELVEEGKVPMSRINQSVRRILRVKFLLGLFENPYPEGVDYSKFASREFTQKSYQAAVESITLLKNKKDILPLSKNMNVLVTGPTANSLTYLNGGWSRTWQGADPKFNTPNKKTILQAIQDEIGSKNVYFVEGTTIDKAKNIDAAVQRASNADAAIICVGESTYTETEGDIASLMLPDAQQQLVKAVAQTNTPVVLVMVEGRPRIVNGIENLADGVLMTYLPGQEGGRAAADILFGDKNPSGKLPFTYPSNVNDLVNYDHNYTDEIGPLGFNPQWEFGHGLSYTTFDYSELKVNKSKFTKGDKLKISVNVKNSGDREGKEVVELYISDLVASITPAVKRLRGFKKIDLNEGESTTVTFNISPDDLKFVGKENTRIIEDGDFKIQVDSLTKTVSYKK